jgi:Putative esterase
MSDDRWLRDPHTFQGRLEMRPFASEVLRGNPLGDPHEREVPVYVPPQGADGPLPVTFLLTGFTGRPQALLETHPWRSSLVLDLDRAMASGEHPAHILVIPDAFTRYGGSQYVNSSAVGRYEDYVADELVRWVDEHYPTLSGRRAIVGKSSGGFGALHLGMRHPEVFPVVGSLSGDCHFEYGYAGDFLNALRGLGAHGGDPAEFLAAFDTSHDLSGDGHAVINTLAMAACYSPNPGSALGFDLPFDLGTGARVPEVWQRWLAFDPVVACEKHAEALRSLDLLVLEAGTRDEFHLQFGLRVLTERLRELDIPFEHTEFEGGHFGLNGRYPALLARLVAAL